MKKSLIFSFNVLTLFIILVLVAGAMGQGNKKKDICPIYLDNQKPGSCHNKPACLSACKKKTEGLGMQGVNTACASEHKCVCYVPCPK
ncbi:hypothetical protein HID58_011514 [Brassica napus]|uniref:Knottin scorpion toxin-like domain-containing protein n=2 Tax=Brassica TaxID=3705 RepID=A0A3P6ACZ0_BRACM|nr:hypothetical protein HID58_011514 [Brassica napus]CAF2128094.1 unnamed protein product [Brassica napus]CAG7882791.1 unnamed protein product [Brassica rapa]VDC82041.1 unnamed protein product [Brassica rapa]